MKNISTDFLSVRIQFINSSMDVQKNKLMNMFKALVHALSRVAFI
ncbi:TPA: hypothetical protein ACIZCU_003113 [Legionella pneumophila]|nr:hypothetical protein [Legionella pneumophila]